MSLRLDLTTMAEAASVWWKGRRFGTVVRTFQLLSAEVKAHVQRVFSHGR
jgi:hypothetical protein